MLGVDMNRAPCYRCGKCPVRPEAWGKWELSRTCDPTYDCPKWREWFMHGGWRGVCAPLRALRGKKE